MTEEEIKTEARLIAIEHLLTNAFRMMYGFIGATPKMIEDSHKRFLDELKTETMEGADPAMSDHVSAEMHDAMERLLKTITGMAKWPKGLSA